MGDPSAFLHVANGTCTTRNMAAAAVPGDLSVWADPLHEGPVPPGLTDDELLDVRARYLAGPDERSYLNVVKGLRDWRRIIDNHEAYGELVLWFEHDLFDQLNLIQLLSWIRGRLPSATVVSLVCIGSFPGRPDFKGLGQLTPVETASLLDTRVRVAESQYALAERAWHAFRSPTPEVLDDLRRDDATALPYLAAAITRFLQEYPWTADGLSRTERRLLELAAGDLELSAAFPRMHDGETAYYITDSSTAALADSLSITSPPLVMLQGRTAGDEGLQGSVALSDTGRAVLAGRQDRIAACGIDRWLGGVHVRRGAALWRWDGDRGQITRS
jgi:hypothetical protein